MSKESMKKLTLDDFIRRKEQSERDKHAPKTDELYIESLGGTITVKEPSISLIEDSSNLANGDGANENSANAYIVYQSICEPNLKAAELKVSGAPHEVVFEIFKPGEVQRIAQHLMKMAGYADGSVRTVDKIKN